jgi:putative phosphoribosyl transferase
MRFRDRADAGRRLAARLLHYRGSEAVQVFGLEGGGLRVGYEVARALGAPLEAWVARPVEVPDRPGLRLGAVSEEGGFFLDAEAVRSTAEPAPELVRWMDAEAGEVALAAQRLRGGHPRMEVMAGGVALLVVDGIAAGDLHVYAALRGLRRQQPRRLVLAAPVAAAEELERLRLEADEVVCLHPIWALLAVTHAYDDFRNLPDIEVRELLERARQRAPAPDVVEPSPSNEWM